MQDLILIVTQGDKRCSQTDNFVKFLTEQRDIAIFAVIVSCLVSMENRKFLKVHGKPIILFKRQKVVPRNNLTASLLVLSATDCAGTVPVRGLDNCYCTALSPRTR